MSQMTPREIVHELNRHIIGQDDAKRAVAIALRNRWRRSQLDAEMRNEVTPNKSSRTSWVEGDRAVACCIRIQN